MPWRCQHAGARRTLALPFSHTALKNVDFPADGLPTTPMVRSYAMAHCSCCVDYVDMGDSDRPCPLVR